MSETVGPQLDCLDHCLISDGPFTATVSSPLEDLSELLCELTWQLMRSHQNEHGVGLR